MREVRQPEGAYCHTYSPHHPPVAELSPGESVCVYTVDAFGNKIESPADKPSALCRYPRVNPLTGPLHVRGAVPGDALRVRIQHIEPTRDFAVTAQIPQFGALVTSGNTPMLHDDLPEDVRLMPLENGDVVFDEHTRLPFAPFIGSIGTAPEIEAITSLAPGPHGGNMDCCETTPDVDLLLPVKANGALLFLGDVHACQGDGELTGVGGEMPACVTMTIDIVQGLDLRWPRIVSRDWLMSIGSLRPLEDAVRAASVDLIRWLQHDFGYDRTTAYHLLGQAVRLRVGNIVDPNYTAVAKLARRYLPEPVGEAHAKLYR